jgi:hypothetical protein
MKSEFLESELELYVQRLLIHESYSTGNKYKMLKISPRDERLKGYDAKISGLTSFYCQFKTSDFITRGTLYNARMNVCSTKMWPETSFYSFSLRVPNNIKDKINSKVWQHNVLNSLWSNNKSGVAYVAPMFHTRTELDLHEPLERRACCWRDCVLGECQNTYSDSSISIQEVTVNKNDKCRIPFFAGLISIPPSLPVTSLKHSYCFNSPADITFHSKPDFVDGGDIFGTALKAFVAEATKDDGKRISYERMSILEVKKLIGLEDYDSEFIESFLGHGLLQAGVSTNVVGQSATKYFEDEAAWLDQRIAFASALKSYFDISTLGLVKVAE